MTHVYFSGHYVDPATGQSKGRELMVFDGTTVTLASELTQGLYGSTATNPAWSSDPRDLTTFNGKLYFSSAYGGGGTEDYRTLVEYDPATGSVREIINSYLDGEPTGPYPAERNDGDETFIPRIDGPYVTPKELLVFDGKLYFSGHYVDPATGQSKGRELMVFDGTTVTLASELTQGLYGSTATNPAWSSDPRDLTTFNGKLYFSSAYGGGGTEDFRTLVEYDPATGAVREIINDVPDGAPTTPFPAERNDGDETFIPRIDGPYVTPKELLVFDGKLYFSGHYVDPATGQSKGRELMVFDGTTVTLASELTQGLYGSTATNPAWSSDPRDLTTFNGKLYFSSAYGGGGTEDYRTLVEYDPATGAVREIINSYLDGEPTGPYPAERNDGDETFIPWIDGPYVNPKELLVFDGKLYFSGHYVDPATGQSKGRELMVFDGTTVTLASELTQGLYGSTVTNPAWSSDPRDLSVVNGKLHFSSAFGAGGAEDYRTLVEYDPATGTVREIINSYLDGEPTGPYPAERNDGDETFIPRVDGPYVNPKELLVTGGSHAALLSGHYWNGIEITGKPVFVTYSFPTSAPASHADKMGTAFGTFQPFSETQKADAVAALQQWADASGLTILEVPAGQGQINFALYDFTGTPNAAVGGIGNHPFGNYNFSTDIGGDQRAFIDDRGAGVTDASGDVFINSASLSGGVIPYGLLLHEIGHALGLKHTDEVLTSASGVLHDEILAMADDHTANTVMSYNGPSPTTLGPLDHDAIEFLYGTNAQDDTQVASSSWIGGELTQTGFGVDDIMRGVSVRDIMSGGAGNDWLFGLGGNDTLNGDAGFDTLWGGFGNDTLTGGADGDTFVADLFDDTGAQADTISDFNVAEDQIDLLSYGNGNFSGPASFAALQNYLLGTDGPNAKLTGLWNGNLQTLTLVGVAAASLTASNFIFYSFEPRSVTGTPGADLIFGGLDGDTLSGGGGDDTLIGDAGADTLDGGAGRDFLYFDSGDTLIGGADQDYAIADDPNSLGVSMVFGAGSGIETVIGGGGGDVLNASAVTTNITLIGGAGIDTLTGGSGSDSLLGQAGADILDGGGGNDFLYFASGDTLIGGTGFDRAIADDPTAAGVNVTLGAGSSIETVVGGAGADILNASAVTTDITLIGGDGIDTLTGGSGNDSLLGQAGADILDGGAGNDFLHFGTGDTLTGGADSDYAVALDPTNAGVSISLGAGSGIEVLSGALGGDLLDASAVTTSIVIFGSDGNDELRLGAGGGYAYGSAGNDTLVGGPGVSYLYFGNGDTLMGGGASDYGIADDPTNAGVTMTLGAGSGIETVIGVGGDDVLNASAVTTNITLIGGAGIDTLTGGSGNDSLLGQAGADILDGGAGNDFLYFGTGDTLTGGADNDYAIALDPGNAGVSMILGAGSGIEVLSGAAGADILDASALATSLVIYGSDGADTLTGGLGADTLSGGGEADNFVFKTAIGAGNIDTIADFSVADDTIWLDNAIMTGLGADGPLAVDAFVIGSAAGDASDRIVYYSATGALFYDADGDGAAAQVQFATLTAGLGMTNADFLII